MNLRCLLGQELRVPAGDRGPIQRLTTLANLAYLVSKSKDSIAGVEDRQQRKNSDNDDSPRTPVDKPLRDEDHDHGSDDRAFRLPETTDDDHRQQKQEQVNAEDL